MTDQNNYGLNAKEGQNSPRQKSRGTKRIMRDSDKEELIQELMSQELGVFKEIWRLMLFAAQLGFKENKKVPLNSPEAGKGIDQSIFGNCSTWPGILYLMSLAETHDTILLSGGEEGDAKRIQLFEQYANGGLEILKEFFDQNTANVETLIDFIDTYASETFSNSTKDVDLTI